MIEVVADADIIIPHRTNGLPAQLHGSGSAFVNRKMVNSSAKYLPRADKTTPTRFLVDATHRIQTANRWVSLARLVVHTQPNCDHRGARHAAAE